MSPGGHLLTTAAACASAAMVTGSPAMTVGIALGGFFIDVDHAVDYVLFEGQRDLRPAAFLRYYMEGQARRAVLALHSYELLTVLACLAWWFDLTLLAGYVFGAVIHLGLDIRYNGEFTPRSITAFYSLGYRLAHRFDSQTLLAYSSPPVPWAGFWATFFGDVRRSGARTRRQPATEPPV